MKETKNDEGNPVDDRSLELWRRVQKKNNWK